MALQHDQDQGLFSYLEDKKATKLWLRLRWEPLIGTKLKAEVDIRVSYPK